MKISTVLKKKVKPLRQRFDPTELRNVSASVLYGKATESQLGKGTVSLGMGRRGGMIMNRFTSTQKKRMLVRSARAKPAFAERDVRQMNAGKPGKQQRGPKVN